MYRSLDQIGIQLQKSRIFQERTVQCSAVKPIDWVNSDLISKTQNICSKYQIEYFIMFNFDSSAKIHQAMIYSKRDKLTIQNEEENSIAFSFFFVDLIRLRKINTKKCIQIEV